MPISKPLVILTLLASADLLFTSRFKETSHVDEAFSLEPSRGFKFKEVSLSCKEVVTVAKWLEDLKWVKDLHKCIKWLSLPREGHKLWHNWVLKHIQPDLNKLIEAALTAKRIHLLTLAEQSPGWPALNNYASNAYVPVALELLGEDALGPNLVVVLKLGVGLVIPQLMKEVAMKKKKAIFKQQWTELFSKRASKKLKKKHVKHVDPKDLCKLTVTITAFQRACSNHFQEEAQKLEPKVAHFMGLLEEVSTFKTSVPQEVQQLLKGHKAATRKGKKYRKSKVKLSGSSTNEIEACKLMLQDHFNKMANTHLDMLNLKFKKVLLNMEALDNAGDLGVAKFRKLLRKDLNTLLQMPDS
ncbi:hypothetical protein PILCRDRAFT_92343 [Piloderma croceum F 1598]|uniref:Uncharacterized protein n=1 Tax=Piloderma croceum (strain F 1598) TaxID=765440 RepID=A0A0C3AMA9_PILCF|nr:hypothetical protein PILCRDRAFT_92343 [Piloderma croceum F 1598]